jgi:beta-glucosidase
MTPAVPAGGSAGPNRFAGELSLRDAVAQGLVSERRIDDMVLRRLTPGFRIGMFDHPARAVREEPSTPEARTLAAEIIQAGAVLLKNSGVLPLGQSARRVAVIGTQAGEEALVVEQGSPYVEPRRFVSAVAGLRGRAPSGVEILYEPGGPGLDGLPAPLIANLRSASGEPGLLAEYFASPDIALRGTPIASRIERGIDVNGTPDVAALPANKGWAARWRGEIVASESGQQRLTVEGSGSAELRIAGRLQDAFYNSDFGSRLYGSVDLDAGSAAPIEIRYSPRVTLGDAARAQFNTVLGTVLRLGHAGPDGLEARAIAAAARSDVAIVFAGHIVGEGWDRHSLKLPADQNELIAAVAAANPRTVVVLVTGGPVAMPWLDDVAAVLQIWLPGDAFGPALAGLIYGDADPGGRLPVTFPADETQGPGATQATYPGSTGADGALERVRFDENLAIGYRYYDSFGQTPLFPFGHGLSYATFALDEISAHLAAGGGAEVRARVTNASSRAGSEVVQVYVGFPASAAEPPRQLKGMAKVHLEAGERRYVAIPLAARAFQVWDARADRWSTPRGQVSISVGRSSRDLAYTTILTPAP